MNDGFGRRDFLKVVGVSGAGATIVGCSTEGVEKLLPYVTSPEDIVPGVATWYSSVCGGCAAGCGTRVRTREGRAVLVAGNPDHPVSHGALCARGAASTQALYHADRIVGPMLRDGDGFRQIGWAEAEQALVQAIQQAGGDVSVVTGRLGPSMDALVGGFVTATGGQHIRYDALSQAPLREAARIAFGRDVVPTYDLSTSRFLVSFGADFLETWLSPVAYGRDFARFSGHGSDGEKGRFVFVGPRLSLTGQNADEWMPVRPGSEAVVALAMANVIASANGGAGPYDPIVSAYDPDTAAAASGISAEAITELARRFVDEGPGLAMGPGVAGHHENATATNLAVLVLNAVAGNVGSGLRLDQVESGASSASTGDLIEALQGLSGSSVVLVHGTNPAYSLPGTSGFEAAFGAAGFRVSFASMMDETAALCDLILPDRHFLEAWGDSSPRSGVQSIQQPVMQPVPVFDTKQTGDVLLSVGAQLGFSPGPATFLEFLRGRWVEMHRASGSGMSFDDFWQTTLRAGFAEMAVSAAESPGAALQSPDAALTFDPPNFDGDAADFVLLVHPSSRFGDGEHSNLPWLQELPDPVSKITWHSWLEMHPDAAESRGLRSGDVVRVASPHGEVEVPLWLYPGIREDTVALAMGGGHVGYGRHADGMGVNAMHLLPTRVEQPSGTVITLATRVSVTATGARRQLASVDGSTSQSGRPIAPAVALASLTAGPGEGAVTAAVEGTEGEAAEHGELQQLQAMGGFVPVPNEGTPEGFPPAGIDSGEYALAHEGPRWAMTIDLDKCTGCSACVVACQSENNVPWVGEQQILMGRELHWIRLERYYEHIDAHEAAPLDIRHLPMLCQHCGNAPCEPVCPVFAAYHTPDGLNAQIYNRCVGTRYCANNCPYKVRVFNWFTYSDVPEPMNWAFNPDVTVREGGVMEKCSFCVQRIREGENLARLEDRELETDEISPACQQACPAEAIVFGNIRDSEAEVATTTHNERAYRVLDELINTQPAVTYLKKVTFHEVDSAEHG